MKSQEFPNVELKAERVASCAQRSGENQQGYVPASPLSCEACIEVLHDLNNAFAAVLMNAQVMECKLPSYSRSKRYIHEIERGAQRGGALVKRLLGHLTGGCSTPSPGLESGNATVPPAAATQEPPAVSGEGVFNVSPSPAPFGAPVFGSD